MKALLEKLDLLKIDDYVYEKPMMGGKAAATLLYRDSKNLPVVIKFLIAPSNELLIKRFTEEVNALKEIGASFKRMHSALFPDELPVPKLIKPIVFIQDLNIYYYIMEYVEAETLDDYCNRKSLPLEWQEAIELMLRISSALSLPEIRYVHRDLHPKNILILEKQDYNKDRLDYINPGVKILDFGCTKDTLKYIYGEWSEDRFRLPGAITSWSPELLENPENVNFKHDSWALGMMLHRMLLNKYPFEVHSIGEIIRNLDDDIALIDLFASSLPNAVKHLVRQMLLINPNLRFGIGEIMDFCTALLYSNLTERDDDFLDLFIWSRASLFYCDNCYYQTGEFIYNSGRLDNKCSKCGSILTEDNTSSVLYRFRS